MCSCARWFELEYEIGLQANLLASAYNTFLEILWNPIKGPRLRSFRFHGNWLTHPLLYQMGQAVQRAGYPLGNVVGNLDLLHDIIPLFFIRGQKTDIPILLAHRALISNCPHF